METLQRALEPYKHFDPAGWVALFRFLPVWAGLVMSAVGVAMLLRGGGMLLAMLILPLYIPVLIFGASATANAALGLPVAGELYFLAGLAVLALTLAPWATAAALRIRLS